MRAFDNYVISAWKPGYDYCEDSTRVFTIKVKDRINSRILYSCDFAVVYDYEEDGEKRQQYIKFNKEQRRYTWEEQRDGFYRLPDKINFGSMKKVV